MSDEDFFNAHKSKFNCYAYAVGDKENPSEYIGSVPGAASGKPMERMTISDLKKALIKDGAIPAETLTSGDLPLSKRGYRLIAGFISMEENGDFHFYRQERDGLWTHKPARCEVQHTDAANKPIKDPRIADRDYRNIVINGYRWPLNYSQFAGFFYIPESGLKTGWALPPRSQSNKTTCLSISRSYSQLRF